MTSISDSMKRLPTDITDAQWGAILALIPPPKTGGRKRSVDLRQVIDAIRYFRSTGCGWRNLPGHFPPRSTVWYYYTKWQRTGVLQVIDDLLEKVQENQKKYSASGDATNGDE